MEKYRILKSKINRIYNVYHFNGEKYPEGMKKYLSKILYTEEDYYPENDKTGDIFIDYETERIGFTEFATKELSITADLKPGDRIFIGNVKYIISKIDNVNKTIIVDGNIINEEIGKEEAELLLSKIKLIQPPNYKNKDNKDSKIIRFLNKIFK
jgi:hypothetical protein